MKNKMCYFFAISLICASGILPPIAYGAEDANAPSAEIHRTESRVLQGVPVYTIKFPGGNAAGFFEFLRTNGFADDNFLFAGEAGRVPIPPFVVKNVQLTEVAKSLDFVTEGQLSVDVAGQVNTAGARIWRIKPGNTETTLKTRACALPHLLAGGDAGRDRVYRIVDEVRRTLIEAGQNDSLVRGRVTIVSTEKIVVLVGAEPYVEAISGALEAAEKVATAKAF